VPPFVMLAPIGEPATAEALALARDLRELGVPADIDGRKGSLKSMLRRANSIGAFYCVVIGDTELARGAVQVKDLVRHTQEDLPRNEAPRLLAERVRSSGRLEGA
jgi:histidyl-tRNA synthetase